MNSKLLIFDLDDTLIDTTGCIAPLKLKMALSAMVDAGLHVDSFSNALFQLKKIDTKSPSGKKSIHLFLEKMGASEDLCKIGVETYYEFKDLNFSVNTLPRANEMLYELNRSHDLVIVSKGIEKVQLLKMQKAGIDPTLFKKVVITNEYYKKSEYQKVIKELQYLPENTIVCGDRVDGDLLPAKELGLKTVHIQWGRGKLFKLNNENIDYSIKDLSELKNIVKEMM
ncbi:hypothetical protein COV17_02915 [Candidatus Woesearchaeota archaeon CG10_big_fil_rev_8_21_14_0_10_36_11]|nr:MAG: hypothetical protein COV17_02915 [Candidatus Woesearchaeota archaeon CG10_big_fil_rev_8_21_14_0_10_36_11]